MRDKGTFATSATIRVDKQFPLDPRVVVENKIDLIRKETWPYDEETLYIYKGMIVGVASEGEAYMLIDVAKALESDYSGWIRIGSAGGGGGSIDTELLEGYMPMMREFSDDFNNDFTR